MLFLKALNVSPPVQDNLAHAAPEAKEAQGLPFSLLGDVNSMSLTPFSVLYLACELTVK